MNCPDTGLKEGGFFTKEILIVRGMSEEITEEGSVRVILEAIRS